VRVVLREREREKSARDREVRERESGVKRDLQVKMSDTLLPVLRWRKWQGEVLR
jgi:hypothetical protein